MDKHPRRLRNTAKQRLGALGHVMETPHTDNTMSEETRLMMMNENHPTHRIGAVMNNLIDEMFRPNHVPPKVHDHHILIDELELMYDAHMTIGGQQNRFNASVIRAAINCISSI